LDGLGEVSLTSDTSYKNLASSSNKAEIARRSKLASVSNSNFIQKSSQK
jgi:hypothetical protein